MLLMWSLSYTWAVDESSLNCRNVLDPHVFRDYIDVFCLSCWMEVLLDLWRFALLHFMVSTANVYCFHCSFYVCTAASILSTTTFLFVLLDMLVYVWWKRKVTQVQVVYKSLMLIFILGYDLVLGSLVNMVTQVRGRIYGFCIVMLLN